MLIRILNQLTPRLYFLLILIACASLLGVGLYLQHAIGLEPCPLCIFQRVAFSTIALIALIAALHGPGQFASKIYNGFIGIAGLAGAGIAGRQIWLQHLPADQVPECGPGLDYMLEAFPLLDALKMVFSGSGECAEIQWRFIGLSIPEWSIIWFGLITLAAVLTIIRAKHFRQAG